MNAKVLDFEKEVGKRVELARAHSAMTQQREAIERAKRRVENTLRSHTPEVRAAVGAIMDGLVGDMERELMALEAKVVLLGGKLV